MIWLTSNLILRSSMPTGHMTDKWRNSAFQINHLWRNSQECLECKFPVKGFWDRKAFVNSLDKLYQEKLKISMNFVTTSPEKVSSLQCSTSNMAARGHAGHTTSANMASLQYCRHKILLLCLQFWAWEPRHHQPLRQPGGRTATSGGSCSVLFPPPAQLYTTEVYPSRLQKFVLAINVYCTCTKRDNRPTQTTKCCYKPPHDNNCFIIPALIILYTAVNQSEMFSSRDYNMYSFTVQCWHQFL